MLPSDGQNSKFQLQSYLAIWFICTFWLQSNLAIRNFLVALSLFLNAKSSLSLWSKWQIDRRKWFLNTNLFLIKLFLIVKFDCIYYLYFMCFQFLPQVIYNPITAMGVQSNLAIRNFLVAQKLFLNAKSSISLWSTWQIGHRIWFLNTNLFLIKLFLNAKFDCSM